jgi:hypothetical protein
MACWPDLDADLLTQVRKTLETHSINGLIKVQDQPEPAGPQWLG